MLPRKVATPVVVGQPFKYFIPCRLFGFDLTYRRKRDGAPVLSYRFSDMDNHFLLEPMEETCTPDEALELQEIIYFHLGTEQIQ